MELLIALVAAMTVGMGAYGLRLAREPGVEFTGLSRFGLEEDKRSRPGLVSRLLGTLDRAIGGRVLGQLSPAARQRVRAQIVRAGSPNGMTVESLIQRQASLGFLGLLVGGLLALQGDYFALAMPVAFWFLPKLALWLTASGRRTAIERELPDFLDVLAVTISAGLGFRAALRRVATMVGGPVGEEMLIALRQIDLGATRRAAFEEMRDRTDAPSLNNFITSFLQAEELGTPITGFLEDYARELRRQSGQRARTAAARANPKISLILTLVITPALSIFMIGSILLMALQDFA